MGLSYETTRERLYDLQRFGVKPGLETVSALLSELGHPQHGFPALHIAGTNGKGSVAAMTASILQAAGVRVGLYTSPHLLDFRERIQVQGGGISEDRAVDLFARIQALPSFVPPPTFFEAATVMAFQYFAEERVEIAVVEVGMGGRFDATNVCRSMGTVITNVSLDHERYLGDTLPAIAFEKAGIMKQHVPVVIGPVAPSPDHVLREHAHRTQAPIFAFGHEFMSVAHSSGEFDFLGFNGDYLKLRCALEGRHQAVNAGCALAVLQSGVMPRIPIPEWAIRQGLEHVSWPGRLERLRNDPLTLCDGAHNPAAAACLKSFLRRKRSEQRGRRLILVIGMMRDKNHTAFLHELVPLADVVILTQIDSPRSASVDVLKRALPAMDVPLHESASPRMALDVAASLGGENDLVCITGSLFLVGYVKSLLAGKPYEPVVG